jgi:O-antigen/teichoic acid export membrane protein
VKPFRRPARGTDARGGAPSRDAEPARTAEASETPAPGSLQKTVIRGVSLSGTGFLLTQLLRMGFYVVLARLASPTDFGQLAAGMVLVSVGMMFAESGMLAAVIHRRDRVEEAASTAFFATLAAGFGLGLLALALSPLVGLVFDSHEIGLVAAAMSGYLLLREVMIVPDALMQRRFSFLRRMVLEPAGAVAFGVTSIVTCAKGMGVWGLVAGTYASVAVQAILSWTLIRWRPKPRLASIAMWRELVGYGRHVILGEIVRRVTRELPTVLVGRFVGTAALGQYQYAYRVAGRPLATVVSSTSYVLFPAFARISHDRPRFRQAFLRALRWVCVVSFPASLILFPLGEPVVVLVFGDQWQQAGAALTAMCGYTAGHAFVSLGAEVFKAAGRPQLLPRMHAVSAALTAILMLALLPFGLIGVAAALSLRSVGTAVYAMWATGTVLELPLRRLLTQIWPPAAAALLMAAVVFPLERLVVDADSHSTPVGLALLAGEALLAVAVYLGALITLAPSLRRELRALPRLARRRGRRRQTAPAPAEAGAMAGSTGA